jgi:hypothetical protein
MAKIKITKKQAMMLENLNKPKILKITESQYKAILKHEGLDEGTVIPQIANSISRVSPKDGKEFRQNVNTETKHKGVFKESEELWKEFVNELYGLHESESGKYKKLIKLMEACGYVENSKLSKLKFEGDKKRLKEVLLSGLHKLEESGSPYMAMQEIDETLDLSKDMRKNELFKGLVDQWLTNNSNPYVEKQYQQGNYLLAYKLARNLGNVGKEHQKPEPTVVNFGGSDINEYDEGSAPWNEPDQPEDPMTNINKDWDVLEYDKSKNCIILKNKHNGKSYGLNVDIIPEDLYHNEEFGDRIDLNVPMDTKNWEMIKANRTKMIIANFVSNNLKSLISPQNYGEGNPEDLFMDGKTFVKLPESVDEVTAMGGSGGVFGGDGTNPTSGGSNYPVGPLNRKVKEISEEQLEESGGGVVNSGEYATPAFASSEFFGNAGKKGKAPVNKGITHKKPMIPGSTFVEESVAGEVKIDSCTKLNNNKEAQNGKCSVGAVDNVVKVKGQNTKKQ